jgi:hypothetical protein
MDSCSNLPISTELLSLSVIAAHASAIRRANRSGSFSKMTETHAVRQTHEEVSVIGPLSCEPSVSDSITVRGIPY